MKLLDNFRSYLYDKDYFVDITDAGIHIYNFNDILDLSNNKISLSFKDFILDINGSNMSLKKAITKEILINGEIESIKFIR